MTSLKGDLRSIMGTPFGGVGHAVLIFSRVTRAAFNSDSVVLQLHDRIEMPEEADGKFQVDGLDPGPIRIELEGGTVHNHGWNIDLPDEGVWSLTDLVDAQVDWSPAVIGRAEAAAREARDHADRAEAGADRVGTAEQVGVWASEASSSASAAASARSAAQTARNASQSARDVAEGHANRAATSETNAAASESAAKQSEDNAGDYAAVATTAATEAVDAMDSVSDIIGANYATHEYVDATNQSLGQRIDGKIDENDVQDMLDTDPRIPNMSESPEWSWAVTDGDFAALGVTTSGDTVIPRIDPSTRTMLLDTLGAADALHRSDAGLDAYPWRVIDEDGAVPLAVNHDGAVDFRRLTRESKAALLGTHDAITYGESETDQYPFRVVDQAGRASLAVRDDGAVDFRRLTPEAVAYIASINQGSNAPDPVWVPEPGGARATYYPTGDSLTIPGTPAKTATVAGALTWEDSGVGWWQKTPEDGPWKITETTRLAAWGSSSMFRLQRGLEAQLPGQGVTDILLGGGSGDRAEEIMWRMGMYEYHLAQEVAIPAEGSVTLTFAEGVPHGVRRVTDGATAGIMTGSLGGVHGRITLNTSGVITFTRITAGEQVTVPAGEEFEPDGRKYRDALAVLNIGKNNIIGVEGDGRVSYEATVAAEQWLRSLAGRHLIMGHFNNWLWEDGDTRFREVAESNRLMAEHYGDRYIDLHGYIISDRIWEDTGITPTNQDLADQARGVIAHSLSADGSHANYAVSDVIVQKLIIDRIIQKGWL